MMKNETIETTATKLALILQEQPNDYYYLKGWIDCLCKKEKEEKLRDDLMQDSLQSAT